MVPSARSVRRWAARRPRCAAAFVVFGLAVILLVASNLLVVSWGPLYHTVCVPVQPVVSETVITPVLVINSPYGGWANGSVTQTFANGWSGVGTGAYGGNSSAAYSYITWNIARMGIAYVAGPGPNAICPSEYEASYNTTRGLLSWGGGIGPMWNQPSPFSDVGLPTNFSSSSSVLSAHFDFSYTGFDVGLPTFNCFPTPEKVTWKASATSMTIQIPFPQNGHTRFLTTTLHDFWSWTYSTATPGIYYAQNLAQNPALATGGLAFEYVPCPTD